MTTPNPIPPHVIEKWRGEFERLIREKYSNLPLVKTRLDKYSWLGTEAMWQGFLLARSTVEIELPDYVITDSAYDLSMDEVVATIESQGYRVKE